MYCRVTQTLPWQTPAERCELGDVISPRRDSMSAASSARGHGDAVSPCRTRAGDGVTGGRAKMRRWKRIALGLSGALALLVVGLVVAVEVRSRRTFDAPFPAVQASRDPAVIARGEYIVH